MTNDSTPLFLRICGSAAEYPNTSGSQSTLQSAPNSSLKKDLPYRICRTRLSPEERLQSASTHMAPSTSQRPCFTISLTSSYSSGDSSFRYLYSCAWLDINLYSGYFFISASTVEKERRTFSRVCASVQSHATSMCVCPIHNAFTPNSACVPFSSSASKYCCAARTEAIHSPERGSRKSIRFTACSKQFCISTYAFSFGSNNSVASYGTQRL